MLNLLVPSAGTNRRSAGRTKLPAMCERNILIMKNKKNMILIILLCLVTVASLTVTVVLLTKNTKTVGNPNQYPAVSEDPGAQPIGEVTSQPALTNPEGGGAVSLTYSKKATAPKGNGIASIQFQNPAKSNQSIVIQLQITDKELIKKIGKTGRTAADKAKIESAGYNSETSRMTIAESGLLAPGYKLSTLQLKALPDGTVLPAGNYSAVYYILAYNKNTNERAIVNMQIPITLTIQK